MQLSTSFFVFSSQASGDGWGFPDWSHGYSVTVNNPYRGTSSYVIRENGFVKIGENVYIPHNSNSTGSSATIKINGISFIVDSLVPVKKGDVVSFYETARGTVTIQYVTSPFYPAKLN